MGEYFSVGTTFRSYVNRADNLKERGLHGKDLGIIYSHIKQCK